MTKQDFKPIIEMAAQLPQFATVKEAAHVWAALDAVEQQSHWWKVEILKQVRMNSWMTGFLKELNETYNIEFSKAYANELRRLGVTLDDEAVMTATLQERIEALPVATAVRVIRADDIEAAVEIAETKPRKELDQFLTEEKVSKIEPFMPLQLRLFNSWNFSESLHGDPGYEWGYNSGHITENLLWYYTKEGDLVIDPMEGSGTTGDACKRMNRRYIGFDKEHDILTGIETDELAQLVFLDPPFYTLKENDFQSYTEFLNFVDRCISESKKVVEIGGFIALIMMNLCTTNEKRAMIGDVYELLRMDHHLEFENMILCPLSTQQPGADRAKKNRELLNLARAVWVFKKVR